MALIDSVASFEKRCDELNEGLRDVLASSGIQTFSALAFAVGTPQSAPSDEEMQRFADRLMGGPASLSELSMVKRIHFEAVTLVMVDLQKHSAAQDLSEPGRNLPFVESRDGWQYNRQESLDLLIVMSNKPLMRLSMPASRWWNQGP